MTTRRDAGPVHRGVHRGEAALLNDDYHLTCDALVRGLQVRFAPDAIAREEMPMQLRGEFERRACVAAGTWQTTLSHLALWTPAAAKWR